MLFVYKYICSTNNTYLIDFVCVRVHVCVCLCVCVCAHVCMRVCVSQGVTFRVEAGELVIARILHGGMVDQQGLLHVGDIIKEVLWRGGRGGALPAP